MTKPPALRSISAALALFALGFGVTAASIHSLLPDGMALYANMRSEKLRVLDEWRGKAYSASFGSSHVHYGFDPRAFDAELAGTPEQTRTVNLAVAGGSQTEQRVVAIKFLNGLESLPATAPAQPEACMVLLELGAGANFTSEHLVHPRSINIYDWNTLRFVAQLSSPQLGLVQRFGRTGYAMAATLLHYTNVGMLSSRIFTPTVDRKILDSETVENRRGLIVEPMRADVPAQLQATIASAPRQPEIRQGMMLPGNYALIEQLTARSGGRHIQFVYLLMPKLSDLRETVIYPDSIETSDGRVPIVNLAQPQLYPQLYKTNLWFDGSHLDEAGAAIATRLIADDLKGWFAVNGRPSGCGGGADAVR